MSVDGAAQGIPADQALNVILGGQPEQEQVHATDDEVRARVQAAWARNDPQSYDDCADTAAGLLLAFYEARPEAAEWPAENRYEWQQADGSWSTIYPQDLPADKAPISRTVGPNLYGEADAWSEGKLGGLGLTGFMWGWAVNTAKHLVGQPPVPNPAIVIVRGVDET